MTTEHHQHGPGENSGLWRAVDASANRAAEALRVLEDVARFACDAPGLTRRAKELRHALAAVLATAPLAVRTRLRDVGGDVGLGLTAVASLGRRTITDLVSANAARATQALRSLAECTAVVAPDAAGAFEPLRYGVYVLERGLATALHAADRLADRGLCVLVEGGDDAAAFERLVAGLVDAGVRFFQIRDKRLPIPALAARVRIAIDVCRRRDAIDPPLVVVNDRSDIAAAVGADGVHLGADDLPVPLARRVAGAAAVIGRTAHDVAEAEAAVVDGADYLGIGPCHPSSTKSFGAFAAPEFLRTVAADAAVPVYAIGGITLDRLDDLFALGIERVAVASAITAATDPARTARAFLDRIAARPRG